MKSVIAILYGMRMLHNDKRVNGCFGIVCCGKIAPLCKINL